MGMHTVCAAVLGSQLPISAPISFSFSQAETIPPEQLTRCDINKHNRHLFSPEDLTEILHRFLQNPESTKARAFHGVRFAKDCTENQKSRFPGVQLGSSTGSAQPVGAATNADTGTDQSDGSGDGAQQPCRISPARRRRAGTICAIFARKDQKQAGTALFAI